MNMTRQFTVVLETMRYYSGKLALLHIHSPLNWVSKYCVVSYFSTCGKDFLMVALF